MDSLEADRARPVASRTRTPADVWFRLLRRLSRGLGERRLTVRGVHFRLDALDFRPGGSAWSFGRVRDVRAVATDVDLGDLDGLAGTGEVTVDRVVAECDALSLGSVATASAVTLTATLSPAVVQTLLDRSGSSFRLVFAGGELRVPWLPGTDLVVEPAVADDGTVDLRTAAVRYFGQRVGLPGWLPTSTTVRPALPAGLRLTGIWRQGDDVDDVPGDGVVVRAVLDDPPPTGLERRHVRDLIAATRRSPDGGDYARTVGAWRNRSR